MNISDRVLNMEESITLAAGAKAKAFKAQGRDILSLTVGEPDFVTPKNIGDAAIAAIEDGRSSFYTVASGLPELKTAIADYTKQYYGYQPANNEIVVGTGAKFILYTIFAATLNPADEVIIPTPYWVSYADQIKMVDALPVFVQTAENSNFKATVEQLESARTDKTKMILLNNPSNPTGKIYSKEELLAIGNWAVEHDILILADDIYGRLVYNGAEFIPISALSEAIRKQTIVVNGVSKTYSMTGWRLGYAICQAEIASAIAKMLSQTTSNPTAVAQYAAIEALSGPQDSVEDMRQAFEERLNTIFPLVNEIPGFEVIKPEGAFYLFPNVKKAMEIKGFDNVTAFTDDILEKAEVALVTGDGFGAPENLRMSYATDMATLKEAVRRLKAYMEA